MSARKVHSNGLRELSKKDSSVAINTVDMTPPTKPSTVFLGDIFGAKGVLPIFFPIKKAKESLDQSNRKIAKIGMEMYTSGFNT